MRDGHWEPHLPEYLSKYILKKKFNGDGIECKMNGKEGE